MMAKALYLLLFGLSGWGAAQEVSTTSQSLPAITVAADGSGQYTAIGAAIAAAQSSGIPTVTVRAGTYTEAITIQATAAVTVVGEKSSAYKRSTDYSGNLVTVTNGGTALAPLTFSTSASKGVTWKSINFANTNSAATSGVVFLRGSKNAFYGCSFTAAGTIAFTGSYASGIIANSYIEALDKPIASYSSLYIYGTTITATKNNAILVYNKGALSGTTQYNSTVVFDTCNIIQKDGTSNMNVYLAAANAAGSVVLYRDTALAGFIAGSGVYVDATTQDSRNAYFEFGTTGAGSYSKKASTRAQYVKLVTDAAILAPYDISNFFTSAYPSVAVTTVDWIDSSVLSAIQVSNAADSSSTASSSSTVSAATSSSVSSVSSTGSSSVSVSSTVTSSSVFSSTMTSSATSSESSYTSSATFSTATSSTASSVSDVTSSATITSSAALTSSSMSSASTTSSALTSTSTSCLPSSVPTTALIVGPVGSTCAIYNTIAAAVAALPADSTTQYIYILAGTYNEKLTVVRNGATVLRGETDNALSSSANKVTIINSASVLSSAGGSANTATFSANKYEAKLVSFYNLNIENSAAAATNNIALAVYAKGTKVGFYGCNLSSSQGTLYLDYGNFFFSGGTIQGTTDFVWGQGAGYFYNSVIISEGTTTGQTIAAHRYQSSYGGSQIVFDTCAIMPADTSVPQKSTYLGRDYSTNSKVAFINSYMDSHIALAGWNVASKTTFTGTFVEANNTGPGADTSSRTSGQVLTDTSAYSIKNVLGDDSWLDSAAIAPFSGWPTSVYTQATATSSLMSTVSATMSATSTSAVATVTVAPTPTAGQYGTISSAIAALPNDSKEYTIYVLAGTYEEQISVTRRGKVTLRGETTFANDFTKNTVLVKFNHGVSTSANQDEETPVVNWKNTYGDGLALYNLNFTNSFPQTNNYAALAADFFGANMAAYGCAFKGFQDTLLANQGVQVFSNCYVEGSVDFIWGYSKSYFHQCYIASNTPNSCITAQNRPSSSWAGGYVFDKSVITYTSSYGTNYGSTCLGRPWSQYAVVVYMNSYLDQHISAAGWTGWSSSDARTGNVLFGEYNNSGPGSATTSRASFATQLTESQASAYSLATFVGDTTWLDTTAYDHVPSYSLTSGSSPATTTPVSTHPTSGTEPPSGAVLVSVDGSVSGSYTSLTAALASLPSDSTTQVIFMYPGTYHEQVPSINRPGPVKIIGYTSDAPGKSYKMNQVTVSQARGLSVSPPPAGHSDAETATIATASTNIAMYNINLINTDNLDGSQPSYVTLAASIYGNKIGFYGCSFIGWQDTLLTGATSGYQYYESCYIDGAIDFIWGYSKAYFKGCTIGAKRAKSAITAHSRASASAIGGYIFDQCLFTEATGTTTDLTGLVFLGRPYSQYALVVVKNSYLDNIIQPAGWKVWSTTDPRTDHITFAEYNNSGPGNWESNSAAREGFGKSTLLTSDTYSLQTVMDTTSWIDMTYWDSIQTPQPATTIIPTTPASGYDGTVPPAGAFIVSKTAIEGKTTYDTIQSALNALPTSSSVRATVFIYPGVYEEQLILSKSGTTVFLGYSTSPGDYSQNQVTISYNKGIDTQADASNSDSATFYAIGNYFQAVNINFANTFGTTEDYASLGFAVRSSKYASLYGCQVYGNQDALLINGFLFASNSYVEGNIDMIWGSGAGYFLNTTISPNEDGVSLTANKRATNTTAAGFVFDQCTITPAHGASYSSVSLGRPWNNYARVAYIESYLDSCIEPAGWNQWSKSSPQTDGVVFGEFANSGPGSRTSNRAPFATQLTAESAAQFQLGNFFSSTAWINMTYVSAMPFVASNVSIPSTTLTASTAMPTSTSSVTSSTVTVFSTSISTLKQTTSTTVTAADATVIATTTTTLDVGSTITPQPTTKITVFKTAVTEFTTVTEADNVVTQRSTVTVDVGTTITPAIVTITVPSTVTVTATSTAVTSAKATTIKASTTITTTATSTPKAATATATIGSTLTVTKTATMKGVTVTSTVSRTVGTGDVTTITAKATTSSVTVFTTSTKTVKRTTTLSCIPANTIKVRETDVAAPTLLPRDADYAIYARAVTVTTVTVTVPSVLTSYVKTTTVTSPGSTATTELIITKTTGKITTLKPVTVLETQTSASTRLSTTTLRGDTITATAITTVTTGKTSTLKASTVTVDAVVTATTTVKAKTTIPAAAVTSTAVATRTVTTVLPQNTVTVTRAQDTTSTTTITPAANTVTMWRTVTSTLTPASTVTEQSTVLKTTTKKVTATTTSVVTKTAKNAGSCRTAT
ncbi:pectin lyase fold/virulence factor [Hypoxylon cercidicola]|nr:pectin lyase fold/virulence factor [Hypoxylon cercidicola]